MTKPEDLLRQHTHGWILITPENRDDIDDLVEKGCLQIWEGRVAYVTIRGFKLLEEDDGEG